jgi:uncharacterized glyoxalase superfamily protein PhnB
MQPPRMSATPPAAHPDIIPMLADEDGVAALDWLARAFGFRERARLVEEDGRLSHGELEAGNGLIGFPGRRYRAEDLEGHRWMFLQRAK